MMSKKNPLEWTVFAVSVVVIGGMVAALAAGITSSPPRRANLRVETRAPVRLSSGFAVPVVVTNDGEATAENARIEMVLAGRGGDVETAELTIDYVPRHSRRDAWVVFRHDPRCCRIEVHALTYQNP